jgi:hypothetical protein
MIAIVIFENDFGVLILLTVIVIYGDCKPFCYYSYIIYIKTY